MIRNFRLFLITEKILCGTGWHKAMRRAIMWHVWRVQRALHAAGGVWGPCPRKFFENISSEIGIYGQFQGHQKKRLKRLFTRNEKKRFLPAKKTRRSENDNTPQPLDQWTNSPFMGQQVGNCKSFTLAHSLANLFAMHCDPKESPSRIRHYIQLASLLFQVDQPSHS